MCEQEMTCCVTGHRNIPSAQVEYVKLALDREIERAIAQGCTHFISGFAQGTDLYFAQIVAQKRKSGADISLEAAIPYRRRFAALMSDAGANPLVLDCSVVYVVSERYSPRVSKDRNCYMVARSSRVIAVYDGRKAGGTYQTIRMAKAAGKHVREIRLEI